VLRKSHSGGVNHFLVEVPRASHTFRVELTAYNAPNKDQPDRQTITVGPSNAARYCTYCSRLSVSHGRLNVTLNYVSLGLTGVRNDVAVQQRVGRSWRTVRSVHPGLYYVAFAGYQEQVSTTSLSLRGLGHHRYRVVESRRVRSGIAGEPNSKGDYVGSGQLSPRATFTLKY